MKDSPVSTGESNDGMAAWPLVDPRLAGVREHYQRVKFFHELSETYLDDAAKLRLQLAGIYCARAVVELMCEAADKQQLPQRRSEIKQEIQQHLRWYSLIERIRIHDFHRVGIVPSNPKLATTTLVGPVKIKACKGAAVYQVRSGGPKKLTTGNSKIEEQRPLLIQGNRFFDDDARKYVALSEILSDFLTDASKVIEEFEKSLLTNGPPT